MSLPNASGTTDDAVNAFAVGASSTRARGDHGQPFVDRRSASGSTRRGSERRQFGSSHTGLSEAGRELAVAIDQYKIQHHRRYLTCDEMLRVLSHLGYSRQNDQ